MLEVLHEEEKSRGRILWNFQTFKKILKFKIKIFNKKNQIKFSKIR
jgi:hypothetical protein